FESAYNQWQNELKQSCRARLLALTDKAANAIEKALDIGDARAAFQLIKTLDAASDQPPHITDPDAIRRARGVLKKEYLTRLKKRERAAEHEAPFEDFDDRFQKPGHGPAIFYTAPDSD